MVVWVCKEQNNCQRKHTHLIRRIQTGDRPSSDDHRRLIACKLREQNKTEKNSGKMKSRDWVTVTRCRRQCWEHASSVVCVIIVLWILRMFWMGGGGFEGICKKPWSSSTTKFKTAIHVSVHVCAWVSRGGLLVCRTKNINNRLSFICFLSLSLSLSPSFFSLSPNSCSRGFSRVILKAIIVSWGGSKCVLFFISKFYADG